MEAPIPGKSAIGIEVPNEDPQMVTYEKYLKVRNLRNLILHLLWHLGKDISGKTVIG